MSDQDDSVKTEMKLMREIVSRFTRLGPPGREYVLRRLEAEHSKLSETTRFDVPLPVSPKVGAR